MNLSYNAWKGTTFWRKTMLLNKIQYIPREFVAQPIVNSDLNMSREDLEPNFNNNSELRISALKKKNQKVFTIVDKSV